MPTQRHQIPADSEPAETNAEADLDTVYGMSGFPRLCLPKTGRKTFFWKSQPWITERQAPADQLTRIAIQGARLREEFQRIVKTLETATQVSELKAAYSALAKVLSALELQDEELSVVRGELVPNRGRILAKWLLTDREILATEARALKHDLDGLASAVRRAHVDLAGVLIELR